MRSSDLHPIVTILGAFILAGLILIMGGIATKAASPQEQIEAHDAWFVEVSALSRDYVEATQRQHRADLLGVGLALTANHIQYLLTSNNPTDCGLLVTESLMKHAQAEMNILSVLYHFNSATLGDPADIQWWYDRYVAEFQASHPHTVPNECSEAARPAPTITPVN